MHEPIDGPRVVGTKQTLKALQENIVSHLFIAEDAEPIINEDAIILAKSQGVPVMFYRTMEDLGKACQIQVGTATAALIKQD